MAMRRQAGFSLIELMVSAALMLILMIGVTRAFTTQQRTYIVVDQVTEAQQNLRAVADLVERDVRRAGFMVPSNAAVCAYDDTDGPDTLFVSNTDVVRTVYDLEDENVSLSSNKGAKVSGAGSTFDAAGASFSLTLEQLWVDYDDPGTSDDNSDFAVGQGVIVASEYNEDASVACGKITAIAGKIVHIGPVGSGQAPTPTDSAVAKAAAVAAAGTAGLVGRTVAAVERDLIIDTLSHCLGNRTHAANILGISIRTLRNKLKQYSEEGIAVPAAHGESEQASY